MALGWLKKEKKKNKQKKQKTVLKTEDGEN